MSATSVSAVLRSRSAALALGAALLFALFLPGPAPLAGQQETTGSPGAAPGDVATPEAIVAATYDVISGPSGEARDWERFRSLFVPEARLIPTGRGPGGEAGYRVFTPGEYVERARQAFAEQGFFEREVHAEAERYGDIAHVFSTYESRRAPDDAEPFQRGINSFQLWHDGERWWIVTILWHGEREGAPIPGRYGG